MLPLNGITVVSVEQAVAAPFATRQLADLGARVIKIERPDGGDFARAYDTTVNGLSSYFVWLNRSKQSITLNLKRPEGAGVLAQLIARADGCGGAGPPDPPRRGVRPEPRSRSRRSPWHRTGGALRAASAPDRLQSVRLWLRPARRGAKSPRPPGAKRGRARLAHRQRRCAGQGRHLRRRYRSRHVRLLRHSHRAARAVVDRARHVARCVAVRRARRV